MMRRAFSVAIRLSEAVGFDWLAVRLLEAKRRLLRRKVTIIYDQQIGGAR